MRVNAFTIFPKKILVAYFLGVVLILFGSSLVVIVGAAQISAITYAISGGNTNYSTASLPMAQMSSPFVKGIVITEQYSRSIYTSSVPETIAAGINYLLNSSSLSYPMTVSAVNVNTSSPLIFRGLPLSAMTTVVSTGEVLSCNCTILGSEAAKELKAHVGSLLSLTSPLANGNSNVEVSVSGIYSVGGEADFEGVVPISLGQVLSGLPNGVANAVVVSSSSSLPKSSIESLITSNYDLILNYSGVPGTIDIVDSSGYLHNAITLRANSSSEIVQRLVNLSLPFGLYSLVLSLNGIRTSLGQFAASKNGSIVDATSNVKTGSVESLFVKNNYQNSTSNPPKLFNRQNQSIPPMVYNATTNYWLFLVSGGAYRLLSPNGTSSEILVIGNTTFDPSGSPSQPNAILKIGVSGVNSFFVTVVDVAAMSVVYTGLASTESLSVPVESGRTYEISVLSSGTDLLLQQNVSMELSYMTASFTFPIFPINPSSVPVSDYSSLGIGTPSKSGSFIFLIAGVAAATLALFGIIFSLFILALFLLSKQFLATVQKELKVLRFVFPSRAAIARWVHVPVLFLLLAAVGSAILISFGVFELASLSSSLTFLGYGIEVYPLPLLLPAVFLLGFSSYVMVSISMGREIFGSSSKQSSK